MTQQTKLIENPQVKDFVEQVNNELVENNDIVATHCLLDLGKELKAHRLLWLLKDKFDIVNHADVDLIQQTFNLICNLTKRPRAEPNAENAVEMLKLIGDLAHALEFAPVKIESQTDDEILRDSVRKWIEQYRNNDNEFLQHYIEFIENNITVTRYSEIAVIQKASK